MSEKKNIDRLFQEKFKDFEAAPPAFVWDNIQEALQEKKKRRVIPLWFKLSGVAALLVLGLLTGLLYLNGSGGGATPVVIQNPTGGKIIPAQKNPANNPAGNPNVRDTHSPTGAPRPNDALVTNGSGTSVNSDADKNTKVNNNIAGATGTAGIHNTTTAPAVPVNTAVAHNGNKGTNNKSTGVNKGGRTGNGRDANSKHNAFSAGGNGNSGVAYNGASAGRNGRNNAKSNNTAGSNNNTNAQGTFSNLAGTAPATGSIKGVVVINTPNSNNAPGKNNTNAVGTTKPNNTSGANTTGVADAGTPALNKIIPDNNTPTVAGTNSNTTNKNGIAVNTPVDTTAAIDKNIAKNEQAVAEVAIDTVKPENELEKLLREKELGKDKDKDVAQTDDRSKWNVKPQLAPVFYNSLSKGSPIDGQFAGNTKSYQNDLSYGLGITYALSSKFTVRSGVNTVHLNYSTQDVQFYASLNGQTNNVSAQAKSANIVVQGQQQTSGGASTNDPFSEHLPKGTFNGSMLQKTGYVEVPVEMAYALLDKKFGINIIGGVSTLFLNQNNVSVISTQGYSTNVGEAQNLNNIHFSTNVGLGFKYRFLKQFEANFEPTFKYQVNTFSRDAGNFKPYFIGLYSGISFSF